MTEHELKWSKPRGFMARGVISKDTCVEERTPFPLLGVCILCEHLLQGLIEPFYQSVSL